MNPTRRHLITATAALAASGCFGKFGATQALYDWNKDVSDNKWLRWLVFLVLIIVPVYELFMFADALVLNTIEFFSGDNPVSGGHVKRELEDGHSVTSSRTDDPNLIRHEVRKDGELVRVVFMHRIDGELWLLDEHKRPLSRAKQLPDGSVELLDADGQPLSRISPAQQERIASAARAGQSILTAAHAELSANGQLASLGANNG